MKRNKGKVIKAVGSLFAALGVVFAAMSYAAAKKKGDSVYEDMPEEKNPGAVVKETEESFYDRRVKRAFDRILSFGGLVVLCPLYGLISLAIYIDNPGPVLFTQKRVGKNREYFKLHKFRSMKMSTPHDTPTHLLEHPEQYITNVGKFLRKYSLDELPQIWDIFIGNMSIIGPRPALWNQEDLVEEREKYGVNDVRPGLTGWAQINGRDELEIQEKAKLDGEYVRKESFWFDLKCFLGTIKSVMKHDGVVEGGTGEMYKAHSQKAAGKKYLRIR